MGQSMADRRTILVCNCDDTMPLDMVTLARGCPSADIVGGRQLCRAELDRFRRLAASGVPMTVGCTQEAPRFRETAGERGGLSFVILRETAGWSREAARTGARSRCDILLDVSGGPALFPAADLRDGYIRADPRDRAAVLDAVLRARDLVGAFDKPRYVAFTADLCAHSRSGIVGCRRCLDLCPTSAIAPAGDHVAIDEKICAVCGQCAAACPTGAAAYALPAADALMRGLRTLLTVYRDTGGLSPILLIHDEDHGGALIDALARYGDGLPANALPFAVNEVTQIGLEVIAAAFAYGAAAVRVMLRARPRHDLAGLYNTIALAEPILAGLGLSGESLATIETDDPFALGEALHGIKPGEPVSRPATFEPVGAKRD